MRIVLGTRGSQLAVTQSGMVADLLRTLGHDVELREIRTEGDVARGSLTALGGQGVFAAALREALLAGECDIAVHSYKDLPTAGVPGLVVAATPARVDPVDALCARDGLTLAELPAGARVGTGSPRRAAQLRALRPDLVTVDIRGNVPTRLARVAPGDCDAVVLARAGLERLGRTDAITDDLVGLLPAAAQGVLAVECRTCDLDSDLGRALAAIDDPTTRACADAERAVLAELGAGCAAPVGALAEPTSDGLRLRAAVIAVDGRCRRDAEASMAGLDLEEAARLGRTVARSLLASGAATIADLHATKAATDAVALWAPGTAGERGNTTAGERGSTTVGERAPLGSAAPRSGIGDEAPVGSAAPGSGSGDGSLAGRTILFPRGDDTTARALRAAGARVVCQSLTQTVTDHKELARAERAVLEGHWTWLVITSQRTIDLLPLAQLDPTTKVAVVGKASARGMEDVGFPPALCPPDAAGGQQLVDLFPPAAPGDTVLLPQSAIAKPTVAAGLRAKGYAVTTFPIYTTAPATDVPDDVRRRLRDRGYDLVVLFAGSVAEAVCGLGAPRDTRCVAFGKPSAARGRELGLDVAATAQTQEPAGLVEACVAALQKVPR